MQMHINSLLLSKFVISILFWIKSLKKEPITIDVKLARNAYVIVVRYI